MKVNVQEWRNLPRLRKLLAIYAARTASEQRKAVKVSA